MKSLFNFKGHKITANSDGISASMPISSIKYWYTMHSVPKSRHVMVPWVIMRRQCPYLTNNGKKGSWW